MSPYIVNLTDDLIRKNHFDEIRERFDNAEVFLKHVKLSIEYDEVRDMKPETLGKIMCSFEIGDVMASKDELFAAVQFNGDCEDMLRSFVATCLSRVIRDRLSSDPRLARYAPRFER